MGEFHFQSSFIYYGQNQPIFMKKNLSIFMTAGSWLQRALALFLCVAALEAVQAAPQDTTNLSICSTLLCPVYKTQGIFKNPPRGKSDSSHFLIFRYQIS